jgi:hypothetical protein
MKKIFSISLLYSTLLFSETLSTISFESGENGEIVPNIFLSKHWGKNWFSAVKYSTSSNSEVSSNSDFENHKNSETLKEQNFGINLLSYKSKISRKSSFVFGLEVENLQIERNEFGYIEDKNIYSDLIVYEHVVDLDVFRSGVYLNFSWNPVDWLFLRASSNITPFSKVQIEQETEFKPLIQQKSFESESEFDLSYSILGEITAKTPYKFSIGGEFGYTYFPMNYDFNTIIKNENSFVFAKEEINRDIKTSFWLLKFIFDFNVIGELKPSFGFGQKTRKDDEISQTQKVFRFGIEKRF